MREFVAAFLVHTFLYRNMRMALPTFTQIKPMTPKNNQTSKSRRWNQKMLLPNGVKRARFSGLLLNINSVHQIAVSMGENWVSFAKSAKFLALLAYLWDNRNNGKKFAYGILINIKWLLVLPGILDKLGNCSCEIFLREIPDLQIDRNAKRFESMGIKILIWKFTVNLYIFACIEL